MNPSRLVLLGHPVSHSLSPTIQTAALRKAGIDLTYEAVDVEPYMFSDCFARMRDENVAGNVTIPHKTSAFSLCDSLTQRAEHVGAVNTFWVEDGGMVGDNTDVVGFDNAVQVLLGHVPYKENVVLLGAGGSAQAVAAAVADWPGSKLTIYNRSEKSARALAMRFPDNACVELTLPKALEGGTLIVNATPVGIFDDVHPVELGALPKGAAVLDLVYKRGETSWVRGARGRGHRACDGLAMLIEQAAAAFERWTGMKPDKDVMWEAAVGPA